MTAKDQIKILAKGFEILRRDYGAMSIKFKCKNHPDWRTLQKGFESKAALDRCMCTLLQSDKVVED